MPEAEVADFMQAFRQDVLEKAAQKLFVSQSHYAPPVVMGVVLPTECYVGVGHVDNSMVGDRYSMGVAGQILQHMLGSSEGRLGVDHPLLAAQCREQGVKCTRLREPSQRAGEA